MFYYSRKSLKMSAANVHFSYHSVGGEENQHSDEVPKAKEDKRFSVLIQKYGAETALNMGFAVSVPLKSLC